VTDDHLEPQAAEEEREVDELTLAQNERDEYLDALQRLKAEFDNYRKRVARDQQELAARAHERLVKELVPVLDDLERALAQFPRSGAGQADPSAPDRLRQAYAGDGDIEEGVRLVHRQLSEALAKEGLTEVPTDGKFDPQLHEALSTQPAEGTEPGLVLETMEKGYRLNGQVLRPAKVVVSA